LGHHRHLGERSIAIAIVSNPANNYNVQIKYRPAKVGIAEGERSVRIIAAVCLLFLGFAVTTLRAEDLSYHGWSGSVLYINNQFFIGCRLESPAAASEPHDPIRVAAGSTKEFAIQFTAHFADPQPKSGQTAMVELALVNGENISSDSWTSGGYSYPTKVLSNGTGSDGKPVTQILLTISTDDPINARLKDATRMKVYWQPTTPGLTDINFSIFDLRHRSVSNPATLLSALDANDTYGAIQAVIACVRNHANVAATPPINTPPANTSTAIRLPPIRLPPPTIVLTLTRGQDIVQQRPWRARRESGLGACISHPK
jgi:hypothetical protein